MVHIALVLGLTLTAAPGQPSVVVVGLRSVDVPAKKVDAFAELFADALASSSPDLKVTSSETLASLLGLERQRQLAGCAQQSSCLVEIVGALGPSAVVSGSVVMVGAKISVSVRALAGTDGRLIYTEQTVVDGEDAVLRWLKEQAAHLGARVLAEFGAKTAKLAPRQVLGITSGIVAGLGAASAVTFFLLASSEHQAFLSAGSLDAARASASRGQTYQVVAWSSVGLAAAGAVAATVLLAAPAPTAHVEVALSPAGGAIVIGGQF